VTERRRDFTLSERERESLRFFGETQLYMGLGLLFRLFFSIFVVCIFNFLERPKDLVAHLLTTNSNFCTKPEEKLHYRTSILHKDT
jgi:hypothetical protein